MPEYGNDFHLFSLPKNLSRSSPKVAQSALGGGGLGFIKEITKENLVKPPPEAPILRFYEGNTNENLVKTPPEAPIFLGFMKEIQRKS